MGREKEPIVPEENQTRFYLTGPDSLMFSWSKISSHRVFRVSGTLFWLDGEFTVDFDDGIKRNIPLNVLSEIVRKKEEIESPDDKPVTVDILGGESVTAAEKYMSNMARVFRKSIQADFNGVLLTATPEDTEGSITMQYREGIRAIHERNGITEK